jgi:hypothetical protein
MWEGASRLLPIHVSPVAHLDHEHEQLGIADLVDHAVVARADSVERLLVMELLAARRPGRRAEFRDPLQNLSLFPLLESP